MPYILNQIYLDQDMPLGWSSNKGWHIVEAVLALEKTLAIHDDNICDLEACLLTVGLHDNFVQQDILAQLDNLQTQCTCISQALAHKKEALGIETHMLLRDINTNDYLQLCMNASTLKQHIRDWLHQRKFELERLEQAYRMTVNGKRSAFLTILLTMSSN